MIGALAFIVAVLVLCVVPAYLPIGAPRIYGPGKRDAR